MAKIIVSEANRQHLLERIKKRFKEKYTEEEANKHLDTIIKILEEQSPDDWRFTTSPVAKFLIHDHKSGFRILGRTYRNVGEYFLNDLENIQVDEQNIAKIKKDKRVEELANDYLELIKNPNADIVHELKTVYQRDMDIAELKHFYQTPRINLCHLIPVNARKIAMRPNAIITEKEELWVRQKELIQIPQNIDYLFFEKLTKEGIDKSKICIYTHDTNGNIKFCEEFKVCEEPMIINYSNPNLKALRTSSYWSLPTYIDAVYLDLKYKSEVSPLSLTKKESLIKFRIELIINYLKEKIHNKN